jgi:hypothetical protein
MHDRKCYAWALLRLGNAVTICIRCRKVNNDSEAQCLKLAQNPRNSVVGCC